LKETYLEPNLSTTTHSFQLHQYFMCISYKKKLDGKKL
jgi:hypothetical protein